MIERWIIIDGVWRYLIIGEDYAYVDGEKTTAHDPSKISLEYLKNHSKDELICITLEP